MASPMQRKRSSCTTEHSESLLESDSESTKRSLKSIWYRRCIIIAIFFLVLVVLLLILAFVVFPIVFMYTIELQRMCMFPNFDQPSNPEFTNYAKYNVSGVRNFYVTVASDDTVSLGVWHLLPEPLINDSLADENYDYDAALARGDYDVVLYFHGNAGNRIEPLVTYNVMRQFFHVIAFDYRSYGDSTAALLTETGVVGDCVQLFKWLCHRTPAHIYIWAHSLGASLATFTIANLRDQGIIPTGLILESAFNNMREELYHHPISKIFAWLPWFAGTVLDPLEQNGFRFKSDEYILKVNCPIMFLHAEDDQIVPIQLGKKLYTVAKDYRVPEQGNATFYAFPAEFLYNHLGIPLAPELPTYIDTFIRICNGSDFGTCQSITDKSVMNFFDLV